MQQQVQPLGYWEALAAIEQLCRRRGDKHSRHSSTGWERSDITSAEPLTVLIDGRSGSGKTTLANDLAQRLGVHIVHLDEFYPGWSGLAQASRITAEHVLATDDPHYVRWDWSRDQPGERVGLDPCDDLIVEGSGSITHATLQAADRRGTVVSIRLWLDTDTRKDRALRRDDGAFDPYWDLWAEQEDRHYASPPAVDLLISLGQRTE